MITLYRRPDDPLGDELQDALDEMVIAYEVEAIPTAEPTPTDVPTLPALRDEGEVVTGKTALRNHLKQLRNLMADWDRFQSDACYLDEDGDVC